MIRFEHKMDSEEQQPLAGQSRVKTLGYCLGIGAFVNAFLVLLLGFFVYVNYWNYSYMPNLVYHQFYPGVICAAIVVDGAYRYYVENRQEKFLWIGNVGAILFFILSLLSIVSMVWFATKTPGGTTYDLVSVFAGTTTFSSTLSRNTTTNKRDTGAPMYLGVYSLGMIMLGVQVWNAGVVMYATY